MEHRRIQNHPILGSLDKRKKISFTFNHQEYNGLEGDTIASALLAKGVRTLRNHEESGTPRGIYCNIGHCYECRVTVDGMPGVRACLTKLENNMEIISGEKLDNPLKKIHFKEDLPRTYREFTKMKQEENKEDPNA